jgi:hypothetical protein
MLTLHCKHNQISRQNLNLSTGTRLTVSSPQNRRLYSAISRVTTITLEMSTNPSLHRPQRPRRPAPNGAPSAVGRELANAPNQSSSGIVPSLNSVRRTLFSSSHHRLAPTTTQVTANHNSKPAITVHEELRVVDLVEKDEQGVVVLDGLNMTVFPREDRIEEERGKTRSRMKDRPLLTASCLPPQNWKTLLFRKCTENINRDTTSNRSVCATSPSTFLGSAITYSICRVDLRPSVDIKSESPVLGRRQLDV